MFVHSVVQFCGVNLVVQISLVCGNQPGVQGPSDEDYDAACLKSRPSVSRRFSAFASVGESWNSPDGRRR